MSSASAPGQRRPTYADIQALPDGVRGEIIAGELVAHPRPAIPHARTASGLGGLLEVWFDMGIGGPGGWWIVDEPELSLGIDPDYDPIVPDIAGWRVETVPTLPAAAQMTQTPDWVCEVLSPRTARTDRVLKVPFYGRAGVKHCWLVDPIALSIEVFRNTPEGWLLISTHSGDETIRAEPFQAMEIPLQGIWLRAAEPEAPPAESE